MKLNARLLAIFFAGIVLILALCVKGDVKAALKVRSIELSLEAKEAARNPASQPQSTTVQKLPPATQ